MRRFMAVAFVLGLVAVCGCGRRVGPLEERWINLHSSGGHLEDAHRWRPEFDLEMYDDIIIDDFEWESFIERPIDDVVPFLIERISLTNKVDIKVASWGRTTEGALAVYVLQHKLHDNWMDAPGRFYLLRKYATIHGSESMNVTPFMLNDRHAREQLIEFFMDRWKKGVKDVPDDEDASSTM